MADQGVNPAEATEPADGFRIGRVRRQGLDLFVQFGLVAERLLEGEQGGVERPLQRREVEPLGADPGPVALGPVLARDVESPMPIEELQQPMAPSQDVAAHVLAAPRQIADRFLGLVRARAIAVSSPAAKEPDAAWRLAAVGLDPLAGPARGQCWGDHLTGGPTGGDLSVEVVPRDAGFVADRDGALARQSPKQRAGSDATPWHLALLRLSLPGAQDRHHELPLAVIEPHVVVVPFSMTDLLRMWLVPSGTTHANSIGSGTLARATLNDEGGLRWANPVGDTTASCTSAGPTTRLGEL